MAKKSDLNRSRDIESGRPAVPDKDGVTGPGAHDNADELLEAQATADGSHNMRNGGR